MKQAVEESKAFRAASHEGAQVTAYVATLEELEKVVTYHMQGQSAWRLLRPFAKRFAPRVRRRQL